MRRSSCPSRWISTRFWRIAQKNETTSLLHSMRPPTASKRFIRLIFVDTTRTIVAVPYDFDWSGLIGTPYATPFPELNMRSVRERKFLGPCRRDAEITAALQRFNELEEKILALFETSMHLDEGYARRSVDYLDGFFETVRNPKKIRREFSTDCA